jgi:hypothetical protein
MLETSLQYETVLINSIIQFVSFYVENPITIVAHTNSFHVGVMTLKQFFYSTFIFTLV